MRRIVYCFVVAFVLNSGDHAVFPDFKHFGLDFLFCTTVAAKC